MARTIRRSDLTTRTTSNHRRRERRTHRRVAFAVSRGQVWFPSTKA